METWKSREGRNSRLGDSITTFGPATRTGFSFTYRSWGSQVLLVPTLGIWLDVMLRILENVLKVT